MLMMPEKTLEVEAVIVVNVKNWTNTATGEKALIVTVNKCSNVP